MRKKSKALAQWMSVALGLLSGCATQGGDRTTKTLGRIIWKGQITESKGSSSVGMHASASYKVVKEGVKVTVDGSSEPLLFTSYAGALSEFAIGDPVRVTLWEHRTLFGQETDVVGVSKIKNAP